MKATHRLYNRYEYLVKSYSTKFINNDPTLELSDIEQELKIKLYNSILAYVKRWKYWRKTGKMKPVPIEFYLRTALNNRVIDFIKKDVKAVGQHHFSIEKDQFDYGKTHNPDTFINLTAKEVVLGGIDILSGLNRYQKSCVCLFLKGMSKTQLQKTFRNKMGGVEEVSNFLDNHISKLKSNQSLKDIYNEEQRVMHTVFVEDDY